MAVAPEVLRSSARLTGRMLRAYARIVGRRTTCRWTDARGRLLDDDALLSAFGCTDGDGPTVVVYWIRDAMAVVTLPYARPVFRRILSEFRLLPDDTVGGRASAAYFRDLGGRYRLLALPGTRERLRQLAQVIREPISCAFAVDGGGPYGHVGTGLIGLAAAINARILPIAVVAKPSIVAAPSSRVRIPLPLSRVVGVVGESLRVQRHSDRRQIAEQVRSSLNALGAAAGILARAAPR